MRPASKALKTLTILLTCIILIVGAFAALLLSFTYANLPGPVVKKAFIIVPGLMGSNLTDPELDNTLVWSANPEALFEKEQEESGFIEAYASAMFDFDDDCNPTKSLNACHTGDHRFGFDNSLKPLADYLTEEYSQSGYEIVVWQYDWRKSILETSSYLEDYINIKGYTDVIFISQGTGGNVVTKYISKPENRAKVNLFIPIAAPFLGTLGPLDWLINKDAAAGGYARTEFSEQMEALNLYGKLTDIPSVIQLLPYPAMWQLSAYGEDNAPIFFNGNMVTFNEVYQYFTSLDFAKTKSESLKPVYRDLVEYQSKDYIKVGDKFRHVTDFVNTYYVVGTGIQTRYTANINTVGEKITSMGYDDLGDGFVWAYSATAGKSLRAENVITVDIEDIDYGGHIGLISTPEVIELIKPVIEKYAVVKEG